MLGKVRKYKNIIKRTYIVFSLIHGIVKKNTCGIKFTKQVRNKIWQFCSCTYHVIPSLQRLYVLSLCLQLKDKKISMMTLLASIFVEPRLCRLLMANPFWLCSYQKAFLTQEFLFNFQSLIRKSFTYLALFLTFEIIKLLLFLLHPSRVNVTIIFFTFYTCFIPENRV